MFNKTKKTKDISYTGMYKASVDPTDIVSCYFNALNQVKGCSYTGQCNWIDMYNNLSSLEYRTNVIYENEYK
ncbi:hypothetical protein [Romboutsia sp.]|uniref:hypothetical protein n=1 Tax=Romboutsia sp. TaxID=1965302 RepID=UPI003F351913